MSGIWADFPSGSQGIYGNSTAAMLEGPWAETSDVALVTDPDGVSGGRVVQLNLSSGRGHVRMALPSAQATVGWGQRWWMSQLPDNAANEPRPYEWRDAGNNLIGYVRITTTGKAEFVNGGSDDHNNTPATAPSDGPVVTPEAWPHLEASLTCDIAGAAEFELRVNGVPKITHSGFSTSDATCAQIRVRGWSVGTGPVTSYFKDFVLWDGSGSQVNDFQGSVSVFWLPIVTDVTTGGWTLSSGANMSALIGVVGPPNDANYIAADDSPPAPARAILQGLPPDITSVRFIVPVVRAAKVDGGDGNLQISLSPNGVDYDTGPDTPITTDFTYWGNPSAPFVSHLNPQTMAPWSPADFATGVQMQFNRTI